MKKLLCTVFIASCTVQPIAALTLPESAVFKFIVDHSTVLKRSVLVGGIVLALHQAFKKLVEREEKEIAALEDGIVIKQSTLKYISAPTSFMMYKQGKYIGLINCMKFSNQCVLGDFIIAKDHRNMGYGKKLLNIVVDKLIKDGFKEIYLNADPFESDAAKIPRPLPAGKERDEKVQKLIKFYEQNGFERIEKKVAHTKLAFFRFIDACHVMQYKYCA